MDDPAFYAVTLKNLVTPWTNRDQTVFAPLNDYTATVIGMVRDDVPFNQLLSADILYVGDAGLGLPAVLGDQQRSLRGDGGAWSRPAHRPAAHDAVVRLRHCRRRRRPA